MGDVSGAVAQAMRDAGCLNRRSLGVREVYPHIEPVDILDEYVSLAYVT